MLSKWLNSCIWPIDATLTGTISLVQSGSGSNGKEGVLYIPQSSILWWDKTKRKYSEIKPAVCIVTGL